MIYFLVGCGAAGAVLGAAAKTTGAVRSVNKRC